MKRLHHRVLAARSLMLQLQNKYNSLLGYGTQIAPYYRPPNTQTACMTAIDEFLNSANAIAKMIDEYHNTKVDEEFLTKTDNIIKSLKDKHLD
jgi:hypothetical protein